MVEFIERRFPDGISWGAVGGPGFDTTVVRFANGKEMRNANRENGLSLYDVSQGVKVQEDLDELIAFFREVRGRAIGFRFKDFTDFKIASETAQNSTDDTFVGDGTTTVFNVVKVYGQGDNDEVRRLRKLVSGTIRVFLDSVEQTQPGQVTVDHNVGTLTFVTPPPVSSVVQVIGEFDVPARFDTDTMRVMIEDFDAYTWGQIPVVEIDPTV